MVYYPMMTPAGPRGGALYLVCEEERSQARRGQRFRVEAARALGCWISLALDSEHADPDPGRRAEAGDLVALLRVERRERRRLALDEVVRDHIYRLRTHTAKAHVQVARKVFAMEPNRGAAGTRALATRCVKQPGCMHRRRTRRCVRHS